MIKLRTEGLASYYYSEIVNCLAGAMVPHYHTTKASEQLCRCKRCNLKEGVSSHILHFNEQKSARNFSIFWLSFFIAIGSPGVFIDSQQLKLELERVRIFWALNLLGLLALSSGLLRVQ